MNMIDLSAVQWRKSRRSNGSGNCVEATVLHADRHIAIRDSKDPSGPALIVSPEGWRSFTGLIKTGRLD